MRKLFASSLMTVVAVPFLMAAPAAKKPAQDSTQTQPAPAKKSHKKHAKKDKSNDKMTPDASTAPKQ